MTYRAAPLFVGEAPSRTSDPLRPLAGRPVRFLADVAGIDEDALAVKMRTENLLDEYPGPKFPIHWGRVRAREIETRIVGSTRPPSAIVLLGRAVARCFDVSEHDYLEWFALGSLAIRTCVLPHPSGLNRWWNEGGNRDRASVLLRGALL